MAGRGSRGSGTIPGYDEISENARLRMELQELKEFVGKLALANSFEYVVASGFEGIKQELEAQLAPLRALDQQRTPLSSAAWERLREIRLSLARPQFTQEILGETTGSQTGQTSKEQAS